MDEPSFSPAQSHVATPSLIHFKTHDQQLASGWLASSCEQKFDFKCIEMFRTRGKELLICTKLFQSPTTIFSKYNSKSKSLRTNQGLGKKIIRNIPFLQRSIY